MRTMRILAVAGLLLAISTQASALDFNRPYIGPINLQCTFIGTSGQNAAGQAVNMSIFKVDTVYGMQPGGGADSPLNSILWSAGAAPNELIGMYYGLTDAAWRDTSFLGDLEVQLFGNGLSFTAYEVPLGTYDAAVINGVNGVNGITWDPNTPGALAGFTDQSIIAGQHALAGVGKAIIDPQGVVLDFNFANPGVVVNPQFFQQKTEIEVVDVPGSAIPGAADPLDILVKGSSTSYLDWTTGYFLNTIVNPVQIVFTAQSIASPAYSSEVMPRTAMGQASQDFRMITSGGELAVGWQIAPQQDNGSTVAQEAIPEPATMVIVAMGLGGLIARRRRRRC